MTADQLAEAVRTADVLVPTVTDQITDDLLQQPDCKLKLIAHFGNGIDNINVAAAHARGITVTNTPKVLTEDTADMTMALILAVPRRLIEGASLLPARPGLDRLEPDPDAGPSHLGQASRHRRHGPDRSGGGAPRQGVRNGDPLP